MKEFLIAFSASTAAIGGIIFAFLISKALGYEGTQSDILDNAEKKILETKKIDSKLLMIFISRDIYDNTEDNLIEEYDKKLNENYFKWENKELYYWVKYVKKDKAYYLSKDKVIEKLIKKKYEFLENKYKILKEIIRNSSNIENIKDLEKYEEFVFLKNNKEYSKKLKSQIENQIKNQIELRLGGLKYVGDAKGHSYSPKIKSCLARLENVDFSSTDWPKKRETQKEIGQLLVEYTYKKEELKYLLKKMTSLKKERDNIYIFLALAYFMIVFGVIYPLNYIRIELDYIVYNNFFRELFSVSGFMLAVLFVIFSVFSYRIYLLTGFNNELDLMIKKLKDRNFIDNKNYIIENFELCESYIIEENN